MCINKQSVLNFSYNLLQKTLRHLARKDRYTETTTTVYMLARLVPRYWCLWKPLKRCVWRYWCDLISSPPFSKLLYLFQFIMLFVSLLPRSDWAGNASVNVPHKAPEPWRSIILKHAGVSFLTSEISFQDNILQLKPLQLSLNCTFWHDNQFTGPRTYDLKTCG